MRKQKNNKPGKLNISAGILAVMLALLMVVPSVTSVARADVATDYLTIKVGYLGMELDEYVEVDKYHWRELAESIYGSTGSTPKQAYSYFQQSSKTKYTAIVDSARGIYISDLLEYANIYYGDVQSLKFYVEDHKGVRTSFDQSALFRTRYYYEDLAGHRTIIYGTRTVEKEVQETIHHDAEYEEGENGEQVLVKEAWDEVVTKTVTEEVEDKSKILGYSFENATKSAKKVQPMLAIEDNWAQFNEEFEHIGSDFSSLNAGTRFRLLFGQTSPTESMTSQSDKYVSCVYVTLRGQPTVGEMGGLNGSYGSHKVTMTVQTDNMNIRDGLSGLMNVKSTNTDVLVITGITVTPDRKYSDLATVTVSYDIVGKGEAAITAGVGSSSQPLSTSETVQGEGKPNGDQETDRNNNRDSSEGSGDKGSVNNSNPKTASASKESELKKQDNARAQIAGSPTTFELSDAAAAEFASALTPQVETAATMDVEEVKKEDNTEEKEKEQKMILLFTGLGCLAVALGGAASELISFRIRLKGDK
ncbi:MAG: hypothetical protein ACI4KL_06815 [Lentihominibacter sp.]